MEKAANNCLGCRTFFEQNEALSDQTMTIQYKNFNIPIVQQKHKWTILKTIISFLNTKGGTIFIGVQDNNCKVQGKQLSRKTRDQFKLALAQLIQRLTVQFVPVVKNKAFSGKYITKINVKQGEPCQTYSFVQKVQMTVEGKNQNSGQNVQIVYSFFRHNMAGTKQIKGAKLLQQAIKKAQNPPPKYNTFHQECNPEPPELQVEIKRIGFKTFSNREARRKFENVFKQKLQQLKVQAAVAFDQQLKAIVIDFLSVQDFHKINNFIKANLSAFNESFNQVRFVQAGQYLDIFFYDNILAQKEKNIQNNTPKKQKTESIQKSQESRKRSKKNYKQDQQTKQTVLPNNKTLSNEKQQIALTFTHINPSTKEKLLNYLNLSISKKYQIRAKMYQNTIMIYFDKSQQLEKYANNCLQANHLKALHYFGFHNQIRMGINTGHLHILNYDKSKENKLIYFLRNLMKGQLKQIQVLKKGNRFLIDCIMAKKQLTCQWLDQLLVNKGLKQFKIPGAQNGSAAKMKVFIDCQQMKQFKN